MCEALAGKVLAIDGKYAIVDFRIGLKKALNIPNACLNDFVVVRGNLIIETIQKSQGKELVKVQARKLHKKVSS